MFYLIVLLCLSSLLLSACAQDTSPPPATSTSQAEASDVLANIEADLHRHIKVLASDEYEGRAPSTAGEAKTTAYLQQEFKALGLEPGNGDSWFQKVPITKVSSTISPLSIRGKYFSRDLEFATEMAVRTKQQIRTVTLSNSELVFAGYGIVAPERGWDDYADLDVTGKTVVVLVNDPGYATQNAALFNGNSMTYYGRWTYKFAEGARQGAAAVLIVHETGAAGYPWDVIGSGDYTISITAANKNINRVKVQGWIPQTTAEALFEAAGMSYSEMKAAAARPGFKALPLAHLTASVQLNNKLRRSLSNNVVARIPGSTHAAEHIIYSAHWDHLGKRLDQANDTIYNGANDNASGTAGLLALARLFKQQEAPERSILFIALTAEESGLLGSLWYADNPIYALANTVANLNMDNIYRGLDGRTTEVAVVGYGYSDLEAYLATEASKQNRQLVQEPNPEKGFYYRSDHFNFARVGVPALYITRSNASREHGRAWGQKRMDAYSNNDYHQPSDEYSPSWDLSGAAENLILLYGVGSTLANSRAFPNWRLNSEFRARRDATNTQRRH